MDVFDALIEGPSEDVYPYAARWYAHIASFHEDIRKQFPKSQKDADVSEGKRKPSFSEIELDWLC